VIVPPLLVEFGWEYISCNGWDKGIAHVSGNTNSKTFAPRSAKPLYREGRSPGTGRGFSRGLALRIAVSVSGMGVGASDSGDRLCPKYCSTSIADVKGKGKDGSGV